MYSSQELAEELARELNLKRVADAIDELDASWRAGDQADLAAQVAAVWALVGALDPKLAKLIARYTTSA